MQKARILNNYTKSIVVCQKDVNLILLLRGEPPFAQRQNVDRFSSIAIVNDIALYFKWNTTI